ncbi:MAG: acylphosphatase [Actinomycetota bacterium]|nr:acylphosphatase [Actinomycetota bacterium]
MSQRFRGTSQHRKSRLIGDTPSGRAQGDAQVLEQFVVFLKQGPPAAQVRFVNVQPVEPNPTLDRFTVRS